MTVTYPLSDVPLNRVVVLPDAEVDAVAPAVARDHPGLAALVLRSSPPVTTASDFVRAAIDELERAAIELLPGWLPEAAAVDRPDVAGLAAVRSIAAEHARRARYPVPFLTDLAILAVTGRRVARDTLPVQARVAALTRIVTAAFDRPRVVLLVPPDRIAPERRSLVAAGAEWLVHHGGPAVWLLGGDGPEHLPAMRPFLGAPAAAIEPPPPGGVIDPPPPGGVIGRPHPASAVEAALEAALAGEDWAAGRRWNQTYQSNVLVAPVRLDLVWPAERCVVELDGPEHCRPVRFEADRQRDVLLQLDGHAVLRFTNARVTHDVGAVVQQIRTYLLGRRRDIAEGRVSSWPTMS